MMKSDHVLLCVIVISC